ncbi:MAG: PLP-dependent aminotransferase family protein [Solirubrobacterales bacterium]
MTLEKQGAGGDGPSPSRDLRRYAALFASRTRVMTSSVMRDLMAITERPEVISLAGGLPDTASFPAEEMARVMGQVARDDSARALQYGPTDGLASTREVIAQVMEWQGVGVDPGDILVTTGGQQAIDLACKALIDPGDVIVAEGPTYPGAIPTFSSYQADVVQVGMDEDGMKVDELEETLARLEAEGRRPKFIYTVPTFQNPAGVTMSLPRRRRLVEIAAERELIVLEDEPYSLLRYEGTPLPTLLELDGGRFVVHAGTFSKMLAPGLRLGWAIAPRPVMEKLVLGAQATTLCPSPFTQLFVSGYMATGQWRTYIEELRGIYTGRRDAMLAALEAHFPPAATWTRPQGGLFVWATLPGFIDTTDLLARALGANVAFVPGRAAFVNGDGGSSMRLNFSASDPETIEEGVRRIGVLVAEQIELYGAITGSFPAVPAQEAGPLADVVELPRREEGRRQQG